MNVVVLGASSAVGAGVAGAFSPGNRLLLTGRNAPRLSRSAERCKVEGALHVVELPCDFRSESDELKKAAVEWQPDLIVNAASAASRLRDQRIAAEEMEGILAVDLSIPLDVMRAVLAGRGSRPVGILFISSFLSVVKSPDREIYGAVKRIHEKALLALAASQPALRLLIVRISKRIPADEESPDATRLGLAVRNGYETGKQLLYYGVPGRLMTALFHIQPLLFDLAVKTSRLSRG
jgi:NADP-dependent 3-hydroxy acid dehydrogenase YdfG